MLEKNCRNIVSFLLCKSLIQQDEYDWCVYALVSRTSTIISTSLMIIIGSIYATPLQTICFLLGILPLRRRLGGYHAKTPLACAILSVAVMLFSFACVKIAIRFNLIIILCVALFISGIFVLFLKPIGNNNLYLSQEELCENKCKVKYILLIEILIIAFFQFFFSQTMAALYCGFGIIAATISFLINKILEDVNHEKNN